MSPETVVAALSALVLVVFAAAAIPASLWRRGGTRLPPRPQGVRVEHADGSQTPCELTYAGTDSGGIHLWDAVTAFNPDRGDRLHVACLPGRSGLVFPTDMGRPR
jgi:hypothetical protein